MAVMAVDIFKKLLVVPDLNTGISLATQQTISRAGSSIHCLMRRSWLPNLSLKPQEDALLKVTSKLLQRKVMHNHHSSSV